MHMIVLTLEGMARPSVVRINRTSRTVSKHIFHLNLIPCAETTGSYRSQIISIKQRARIDANIAKGKSEIVPKT
jgi:hypothetical protein